MGLGGVGSYAAEALCRAGIGKLTLVDGDTIHASNRNRQLLALKSTEGKLKTEIIAQRLYDINPKIELSLFSEYTKDQRMIDILDRGYDYVIDAIDTLSPKIYLIYHTVKKGMPIVSSMGAGGKLDPTQVKIADLSETHTCKLAFDIRKRLRRLGIVYGVKAVFSTEAVPMETIIRIENEKNKKSTAGTISYMPCIFGCFCASVVIRDLTQIVPSK